MKKGGLRLALGAWIVVSWYEDNADKHLRASIA